MAAECNDMGEKDIEEGCLNDSPPSYEENRNILRNGNPESAFAALCMSLNHCNNRPPTLCNFFSSHSREKNGFVQKAKIRKKDKL
uniref:Uncharacterized protein n=1 Tax=Loa loa TaxID=7209 RepID=A0A1I7VZD3_LOALO